MADETNEGISTSPFSSVSVPLAGTDSQFEDPKWRAGGRESLGSSMRARPLSSTDGGAAGVCVPSTVDNFRERRAANEAMPVPCLMPESMLSDETLCSTAVSSAKKPGVAGVAEVEGAPAAEADERRSVGFAEPLTPPI